MDVQPMATRGAGGCARAASGHAAAAPPSAASSSRRPMVTVIRPSRTRCVKATIPRHRRAVFTFGRAGTPLLSASDLNDGATTPPAPAAAQLAAATPSSLAFPDKLPLPLLSRHRLSADLLALLYPQAVDEHAEVLADRNQRPMLVVHLHAQRAIGAL